MVCISWVLFIITRIDNHFRFWEPKLRCLIRMAVTAKSDAEVNLHAIAALLKLVSVCAPAYDPYTAEKREAVSSSADAEVRNDPVSDLSAMNTQQSAYVPRHSYMDEFMLDTNFRKPSSENENITVSEQINNKEVKLGL